MLTKSTHHQPKLNAQEKRTIQARVKDWAKQEQRKKKPSTPKTQKPLIIEITESQESPKQHHLHQQEKSSSYPTFENNLTKSSHIIEGIALPHACQRCEIYEAHLKIIQAQFEALQGEINRLNNYELNQHES